jgi:hypothetical protein
VREEYNVRKIEFNVDIPDDVFRLEIPANARVWDGVTGRNVWLAPGVRPRDLFPEERSHWLWHGTCALLAVVALAAFIWLLRRKLAPARKPLPGA